MENMVPINKAVSEVVRSEWDGYRYTNQRRPWYSPTHYSKLMGRGHVVDPDGSIAYYVDDEWMPNALTNEGQSENINVWLRGTSQSAGYYLGLLVLSSATTNVASKTSSGANLSQTALGGGATITEETVTSSGYARIQVTQANWGAPALNTDEQTTAAQKTFGPATTGAWTGTTTQPAQIAQAMLVSSASGTGTLVLWIALSANTSIALGQSFAYTLTLKVT